MTEPAHRPDLTAQRAVLATARAILLGADQDAHTAAETGTCPACTTMAALSFGFALVSTFQGEQISVSGPLRAQLLAAVEAARREIDGAPN